MYSVFVNGDWVDYGWLRNGCIDEQHFNWFYSLWTANNPDIRKLLDEGQFRTFVSSGGEYITNYNDMISHDRRFSLHNVDNRLNIRIGDGFAIL